MKRFATLLILLLATTPLWADGYETYYRDLPIELPIPQQVEIPDFELCITDFGGVGDGITLNTEPFRKAIAALEKNGGGRLVVPEGVWMVGLISLNDNIELHLERNAILMATPDKSQFFKINDRGERDSKPSPMISASKRRNIALTGEGVIDGNGVQWRPVKRSKVSDVEWAELKAMGGTEVDGGSLWYPFDLKHHANVAESYAAQGIPGLRSIHDVRIENCTFVYTHETQKADAESELIITNTRFIPYGQQTQGNNGERTH